MSRFLIPAPDEPGDWPAWRDRLEAWRRSCSLAGTKPAHEWVRRCFTAHKILLWDERFHDRRSGTWLVEDYVDAFEARFGSLDGVILWHAYPNLGFDRRNQFDFWRCMPGGLQGLADVTSRLHVRGIRVLLAYNPWDMETRREGRDDAACLADFVTQVDADGLYLDTLSSAGRDLSAALEDARPGIVLQSQAPVPPERLADHRMGWAESWDDSWAPGVFANRILDRHHMIHVVRRWMADHTPEIQLAWMNGVGMVVWENVFGSWNGWRDRDAVQWNLASQVLRRWSRHICEGTWTPLACMPAPGVFASSWELDGIRLWTLINRNRQPVSGVRLPVSTVAACDPVAGRQLAIKDHQVAIDIPAAGLGAVVEEAVDSDFLEGQANRHRQLDHARHEQSRLVPRARTLPGPPVSGQEPDGVACVTGGLHVRRTRFRLRECGMYESARAGESTGPVLPGLHSMVSLEFREDLSPFAIDRYSVTVAAYRRFAEETGYSPDAPGFFLEPGAGPHEPVTRVDPDDARAYASWLGRRLPTEAEWQRAAEDGLLGDDPVRVWNWTEPEMSDGRTRFCVVKGGSHHHCATSDWYADGGVHDAAFAAKYLLMWPGLDRCATIGFRTAVDLRAPDQTG
ncbi:MAG: SUMF1/EgtB/PvdO family nonheme iron enzyme [bacterium]|nr:SUMF1/EgtB/PvdO family nonheme iron enzyme [bacterium]